MCVTEPDFSWKNRYQTKITTNVKMVREQGF